MGRVRKNPRAERLKFSSEALAPDESSNRYVPKDENRGRKSKYKEEYCDLLVEMMSKGKTFAAFISHIGIHPSTANYWVKNRPDFRDAKDRAILASLAYWEDVGERASRGEMPGANAALYKFLVKNRYPTVYKETQEVTKQVRIHFETSVNETGQIQANRQIESAGEIIDLEDRDITLELDDYTEESDHKLD